MTRVPHFRKRIVSKLVALVGVGALLTSACTAPATPAATSAAPAASAAAAPAAAATAAAAAKPNLSNKFTLAVMHDAQNIDPAVGTDLPARLVDVNLYESLIRYEGKPPVAKPNMAESITASADAKVYTVKLRPNLKFHDESDVDAAAVAFSMDRLLKMNKGGAAPFLQVLGVGDTKAIDKLTVQFNLKTASAVFPGTLSFFFIVNPKVVNANKTATGAYGADGDFAEKYLQTNDAGSGPYRLKSRTPNADLQFEAHASYWRGWKANQYGLFTYRIVAEPATVQLLMRQGEVDGAYETYPVDMFNSLASATNVTVNTSVGVTPLYLFMNNKQKPLDNVKVRQAIAYAFDYDQAVKNILPGSQRMVGPLPAGMWTAASSGGYVQNLDKAKALLAEAGIKPGTVQLEFASLGGPANFRTKLALLLQDNLSKVGIELKITENAWADILSQVTKPETTRSLMGLSLAADYADPDALLYQGWHSKGNGSWSGAMWYSNPKLDTLIDQGRTVSDVEKRLGIYQEAQKILIEDSPGIFLANIPVRVALNKSVGGYDFVVSYYNYSVFGLSKN